jgi:hypothetical protein
VTRLRPNFFPVRDTSSGYSPKTYDRRRLLWIHKSASHLLKNRSNSSPTHYSGSCAAAVHFKLNRCQNETQAVSGRKVLPELTFLIKCLCVHIRPSDFAKMLNR